MTHTSTEQERAEFEAWAKSCGFELGRDPISNGYIDFGTADAYRAWKAARRAQVVHVNLSQADSEKMIELVQSGNYQIVQDDAAPQPPECLKRENPTSNLEAAPVQMPEAQAEVEVRSMKTYLDLSIHEWSDTLPDGCYKIYTEQQVRQLLAAHGVK